MWKNEPSHQRQKSSPLNKSYHDSHATPALRHNELEKYKEKISRCQKQSPIVKAFNNIDDFYRSIRPSSIPKKSRAACKDKFDSNLSFNSKKSSEDSESLSSIVDIKQLEMFNEIISEDSLKQETELYQSALKFLYDKMSSIYNKRKISIKSLNLHKNDGLVKED